MYELFEEPWCCGGSRGEYHVINSQASDEEVIVNTWSKSVRRMTWGEYCLIAFNCWWSDRAGYFQNKIESSLPVISTPDDLRFGVLSCTGCPVQSYYVISSHESVVWRNFHEKFVQIFEIRWNARRKHSKKCLSGFNEKGWRVSWKSSSIRSCTISKNLRDFFLNLYRILNDLRDHRKCILIAGS